MYLKINSTMSLVPTGLSVGLTGLTSFLKGLHIPPCLIVGGKIYGGISLVCFLLMSLIGTKKTYNGLGERVKEGCMAFGLSLVWPVFLFWMFNDDEDDMPQWKIYEAHRKNRENQ
jgi:hypothetical protein